MATSGDQNLAIDTDRRRQSFVNPDVRAESRVWHSLIAGYISRSQTPSDLLLRGMEAHSPPRTCPHCGVSTVKSKPHCPKRCEWRRCLACCLPYSGTTVLR